MEVTILGIAVANEGVCTGRFFVLAVEEHWASGIQLAAHHLGILIFALAVHLLGVVAEVAVQGFHRALVVW